MRKINYLLLLFFLSGTAFAHIGELAPAYKIKKTKKDSALKKTESVITFLFKNQETGVAVNSDIKMSYNGTQVTAKKDQQGKFSLALKPGNYIFAFYYNNDFYEITTSSVTIAPQNRVEMEVYFSRADREIICKKPVIYVYPKEKTEINIKLKLNGSLDFTYPLYNESSGWNFTADSTGSIYADNKIYNYLFWEGKTGFENTAINRNQGFIVKKEELINFLEEKLLAMGFNSKESADFITYWAPLMSANKKNYIHFLFNEQFGKYAPLNITPKPDNVFRVFMVWNKAEENSSFNLAPQFIPSFNRTGFTVVEWGGTENKPIVN